MYIDVRDAQPVLVKGRRRTSCPCVVTVPMSWLKAEHPEHPAILVTPEVSRIADVLVEGRCGRVAAGAMRTQNKYDMSVTPPVSHVEMWPYAASAAVGLRAKHRPRF